MTDKKLTDAEIKKALECCVINKNCNGCPHYDFWNDKPKINECLETTCENALAYINRLEAENERLKTEKDNLIKTYRECQIANLNEFAERLKEQAEVYTDSAEDVFILAVGISKIDNLLKEMVGEDNV